MQKRFGVFPSQNSVGLKVLLFITLLSTALPSLSLAACANYHPQVEQAVRSNDFAKLNKLLATLKQQRACRGPYLNGIERSLAQIAAAKADRLVEQGQLTKAKAWLKRAPTIVWQTQAVQGDIAAKRQQWQAAAHYYNQALELVADPEATPQAPKFSIIDMLYQLAYEAQILVGNLDAVISPSGEGRGMMRGNVRGFAPRKRLIPIQFTFGQRSMSPTGKKAANRLAAYLKRQKVAQVTLIGHSDSKGRHRVCNRISKQRAKTVKTYLQKAGVTATIKTIGKGKREPLKLANRWKLKPSQIDALNRRVEFKIVR
jgi:outer membrane protein OmpA-like peptidoglycan-associated protein